MFNKIVSSVNGTLTDKTLELTDYYAGTVPLTFVAAQDKIYIGSKYPFTRKYLKVSTANSLALSVATVKYWDGFAWRTAYNVVDGTSVTGHSLGQSGYLSWETDKQYPWMADDTVINGTAKIPALSTLTLYDFYWVEISLSANLSATLAWAGDLFCTDNDLGAEFPALNRANVKAAYASGKTDWEEQRIVASRVIAQDLKRMWSPSAPERLLGPEQMLLPAVTKTAEIIFSGMGDGYKDSMALAAREYTRRMDPRMFQLDLNGDGRADTKDANAPRTTRLFR